MKISTTHNQEKGLTSIVITMFLMVVITLTILGFAQLSRREQRQTLDRQLSTQAFYAAETGVNDAVNAIQGALTNDTAIPEHSDCGNDGAFAGSDGVTLGDDATVSYTCVLIDPTPATLLKTIEVDKAEVIAVRPTSGGIDRITLKWGKLAGGNNFNCPSGSNNFPPSNQWNCDPGILRVDLVQASDGFTRSSLNDNTFTAFFYPGTSGAATIPHADADSPGEAGLIRQVRCQSGTDTPCEVTITGLSGNSFFLRVRSMYATNNLVVSAADGGTTKELRGSQVSIDSTGKANDVLRRINVRLPLQEGLGEGAPPFALQTGRDICKRFVVYPNGATDEASVSDCRL